MKQAINTRTQEEYDALMRYYESKGIKWMGGEDATLVKVWTYYSEKTCVYLSDLGLEWESIHYFELKDRIIIPFTEFAKANIEPDIDYKAKYEEAVAVIYLAKGALSDIVNWDEEIEDAFGDQGMRARGPLKQIDQFLTNHKDGE